MILIDVNLLIYSATPCPLQNVARNWLDSQITTAGRVGLPWASLIGFVRLVTNVRIYKQSVVTVEAAWEQVETWLDCPSVWIPSPTERHRAILGQTLKAARGGGKLVPDADLAALAIEHGLTLCTTDGDFGRFPGLKWMNPLQS